MKKILLILLMIITICLVGCQESKPTDIIENSGESQVKNNENQKNEIKLEGRVFNISNQVEPEISDCHFSFKDTIVEYWDFGFLYLGDYQIDDNNIRITFTSVDNEYSPFAQPINVDVQLKMVDNNELEVVETPIAHTIKTSVLGNNGWEYDGKEKEMNFTGIIKGYQFIEVNNEVSNDIEPKNYEQLTNMENKELHVKNVIENEDSFELQGVIYELYTLRDEEVQEILSKGTMTIEGIEYDVRPLSKEDDLDGFDTKPEYGLFTINEATGDEYALYTIGRNQDNLYEVVRQAQVNVVYRKTEKLGSVKVNKDIICEEEYTGEQYKASEILKDFNYDSYYGGLSFEFTDGICTKVYLPYNY